MAQGTTREWQTEIPYDGQGHFEPGEAADIPLQQPDGTEPIVGALFEVGTLLKRVGGVASMAARRKEIRPGVYTTTAIVVKWDSFGGPAERLPKQQKNGSDSEQADE